MNDRPIPYYAFNENGEEAYDYDYGDDYDDERETPIAEPNRYIVAIYEIDRAYGGPEEGGWYYDCGAMVRQVRIFKSKKKAYRFAGRLNHWLDLLAKKTLRYNVGSVCYSGGQYSASVYGDIAPKHYPETRPHYE